MALAVGLVTIALVARVDGRIDRIPYSVTLTQDADMTSVTSTWVSGGVTHSVTTTQQPGESVEDMMERHRLAVEAAQRTFPVDE